MFHELYEEHDFNFCALKNPEKILVAVWQNLLFLIINNLIFINILRTYFDCVIAY